MLVLLAGLYGYLMKPDVTGFLYDDGMYLMAAKALANGQGYRLPEIIGSPWFYKYPPLYPTLLAVFWNINPHFPGNIPWLKGLNVLLTLITLGLWGYYFRAARNLSMGVCVGLIALLGVNWRLIEVSVELMSEPLFMLLSVLTLLVFRHFQQRGKPLQPKQILMVCMLSVAAFYARSMALPLIAAIALWLWLAQQKKQAVGYALGAFIGMLPWFLWSSSRKDTTYALGDFLIRSFQETYMQSMRMDLKYEYNFPTLLSKGINELLGNFSLHFFPLLDRLSLTKPTLLSEGLILGLSFGLLILLVRYTVANWKQKQISVEGLYVSMYLLILPFWSFYRCYPRFVVPVLPLLMGFLLSAIAFQLRNKPLKLDWRPGLLLLMIALNLIHLTPFLQKPTPNALLINSDIDLWAEHRAAFDFIRQKTEPGSRFHLENTDEVYFYALNTQRPTLDFFVFLPNTKLAKACTSATKECLLNLYEQNAAATLRVLEANQVQYIVFSRLQVLKNQQNSGYVAQKTMPITPLMVAQSGSQWQPVFQSERGIITIYGRIPIEQRVSRALQPHSLIKR